MKREDITTYEDLEEYANECDSELNMTSNPCFDEVKSIRDKVEEIRSRPVDEEYVESNADDEEALVQEVSHTVEAMHDEYKGPLDPNGNMTDEECCEHWIDHD